MSRPDDPQVPATSLPIPVIQRVEFKDVWVDTPDNRATVLNTAAANGWALAQQVGSGGAGFPYPPFGPFGIPTRNMQREYDDWHEGKHRDRKDGGGYHVLMQREYDPSREPDKAPADFTVDPKGLVGAAEAGHTDRAYEILDALVAAGRAEEREAAMRKVAKSFGLGKEDDS